MNKLALLLAPLGLLACGEKPEDVAGDLAEINNVPVADAGSDLAISTDDPINLDGGASFDPDGDLITFTWSFDRVPAESALAGQAFPANGTTNSQTTFTPDAAGTYIVSLVVTDTAGQDSVPDFVVVSVEAGSLPVADAGSDLAGFEGDNFIVDGAGSWDPLGRELAYTWAFETVPATSALTALQPDGTTAGFTADVGGRYVVSLVVDNGISNSAPDTVVVDVSSNNPLDPVADPGEDFEGEDCTAHTLDGSASFDPNGDPLQYRWSVQNRPAGSEVTNASFSDRNAVTTTFYPDESGEYVLALSVYDGTTWSAPSLITLTATERSFNTPPAINAGTALSMAGGDAVCVESGYSYRCDECGPVSETVGADATATDADGDPLDIVWTALSGTVSFDDPNALTTSASFQEAEPTEPSVCDDNEYQLQLSVTDCTGATVTAEVVHVVTCCGVVEESGS